MFRLASALTAVATSASAASSAAPAPAAAAPSALYGLSAQTELVRRDVSASTGAVTWSTLGAPLPYAQAQQLSTIDSARAIFYMVGYDESAQEPFLVGVNLADGSIRSRARLPFFDGNYVGIGQYVAVEPDSARVFVGGQDPSKNHLVGLVEPTTGAFEILANLSSQLRDVFGGTSVYVPETRELWFELDLDIMILNMTSRKVTTIPVNETFAILGMNLDGATGNVIGLDGGPGQGVRTIVSLDPRARAVKVTGTVPKYAMQMGGMTAYDSVAKTVFWVAQTTNAPSSGPWFVVQNEAEGGKVVSADPVCATGAFCPWSIHYYNAP